MLGVIIAMDFQKLKYYTPPKIRGLTEVIKSDLCIYGGTDCPNLYGKLTKKKDGNMKVLDMILKREEVVTRIAEQFSMDNR
jgi:hypothetical protein